MVSAKYVNCVFQLTNMLITRNKVQTNKYGKPEKKQKIKLNFPQEIKNDKRQGKK